MLRVLWMIFRQILQWAVSPTKDAIVANVNSRRISASCDSSNHIICKDFWAPFSFFNWARVPEPSTAHEPGVMTIYLPLRIQAFVHTCILCSTLFYYHSGRLELITLIPTWKFHNAILHSLLRAIMKFASYLPRIPVFWAIISNNKKLRIKLKICR